MRFHLRFLGPLTLIAACSSNADSIAPGTLDYSGSADAGAVSNGKASSSDSGTAPSSAAERAAQNDPSAVVENDFIDTAKEPTSTFGIDVDTGSYTIMRRDVSGGHLPSPNEVRSEEFINYFHYDYPQPVSAPFSVYADAAPSKFGENLHLLRIGLQGKVIPPESRAKANLVFLVDVSGSMADPNKLPLVQYTLKQLVRRLGPNDTLSIVTYAGFETVLLQPTAVVNKSLILDAIDGLTAGGSTNGEGGIRKAYELAEQTKEAGAINRVVLCTDGDFNVGLTGDSLIQLIEQKRDEGVTLSTFGYGQGNYQDAFMEQLADKGNGNYAYIDGAGEANRVLGEKLVSTLQVIAKDVKIQVEFQPGAVTRYRLVGYENRVMANEDFRNDAKDSGELGAGHQVTALYEIELVPGAAADAKLADVRLRHKEPEGDTALEQTFPFLRTSVGSSFDSAAGDFRFTAAVAEYAEILRGSKHSSGRRFDEVISIIDATKGAYADRSELAGLVSSARSLPAASP